MTQIFAHRGSKSNRPENTLAAFAEAIRVGADGIELDVHRTKDGQLIVIHDEILDRTTSGSGLVRRKTLAEIKTFDAGSWFHPTYFRERVMTLAEVLDFLEAQDFKGILNIEIKTDNYPYWGIEKQIANLMTAKKRPFPHMYCSFNILSLYLISKYDPDPERAYLFKTGAFPAWLGKKAKFVFSMHPQRLFLKNKKALAKIDKGLRLWTLNKEKDMMQAFELGLAGFMTDKPELAREISEKFRKLKEK